MSGPVADADATTTRRTWFDELFHPPDEIEPPAEFDPVADAEAEAALGERQLVKIRKVRPPANSGDDWNRWKADYATALSAALTPHDRERHRQRDLRALAERYPNRLKGAQRAPADPPATATSGTPGGKRYALAALRDECAALAEMTPDSGRNSKLNDAAYKLGRHVGAGNIDKPTVVAELDRAARACKLPEREITTVLRDTPDGAINVGQANPRHAPEPQEFPEPSVIGDGNGPTLDALEVEREANRIRVREAAREKVRRESEPEAAPLDHGWATDMYEQPSGEAYRADGLILADANTAIVAQAKTGKTTLALGLARSLVNGERFLGRFDVTPVQGSVAVLNYEMSPHLFARWAHDIGNEGLYVVNLRGRRNPLAYDDDRAQLATVLRDAGTESLVVDTFSVAYSGDDANDNTRVRAWLEALSTFAHTDVGARDLIVTVHAGHAEVGRARGASAIEDWRDVAIRLTRDERGDRYLSADGRMDHDLPRDRLTFDPTTRLLALTGDGNEQMVSKRREVVAHKRAASDRLDAILEFVASHNGCTTGMIESAIKGRAIDIRRVVSSAVESGRLKRSREGNTWHHYLP